MESSVVLSTSVSPADTSAKCERADKGETQEANTDINTRDKYKYKTRDKYKYKHKRQIQI